MKKLLLLLAVGVLLVGCDPVHTINFTNNTAADTKVKIMLPGNNEVYEFKQLATGDSIVFLMQPKEVKSINFGIGTWSDEDIDHLAAGIKSLQIETRKNVTLYNTKDRVKTYLQKAEKVPGVGKQKYKLTLNNKQ